MLSVVEVGLAQAERYAADSKKILRASTDRGLGRSDLGCDSSD